MIGQNYEEFRPSLTSTNRYERLSKQELGAESSTNDIFHAVVHLEVERAANSSDSIFNVPIADGAMTKIPRLDFAVSNGPTGIFHDKRYNYDYDEKGNFKALIYSSSNSSHYIKLKYFKPGSEWTDKVLVTETTQVYAPRIALESNGMGIVAYLKAATSPEIHYALIDLTQSNPTLTSTQSTTLTASTPHALDVAINTDEQAVVFWAEYDANNAEGFIKFRQYDSSWDSDETQVDRSQDFKILDHSLKVALRGSGTFALSWFEEDNSEKFHFMSALYDPTESASNRTSDIEDLPSQPEDDISPLSWSYSTEESQGSVFYVWTLSNGNTYTARLGPTQDQFALISSTPIKVNKHVALHEFTDSSTFSAGTGGGNLSSIFPATSLVPVRPGFSPQLIKMKPTEFIGLFTPETNFRNID
jgi:hypothetical protein